MKRLLLLPTAEELSMDSVREAGLSLYECCRLTAFIFSVAVTFPIPNTFDVLQFYVAKLKAAVEVSNILRCDEDLVDKLLLWILMLGGIAALDKPERQWFVEQMSIVRGRLGITWDDATEVFENFLWLESACGVGGWLFWKESEALHLAA